MRRTGYLLTVCAMLVACAALAPAADAVPLSSKKAIWGPARVDGVSQFPIYRDLGAGIYQSQLHWNEVAPTRPASATDPSDPGYQWPADVDFAAAEAQRYGIRVSLMITYTPAWANGGRSRNWVPSNVSDLADFAAAAARRYPSVKLWMVWGEPTRQGNFMPLEPERPGRGLTKRQARAPRYYARMLDATYGALKQVSRSNIVIGGNTFTVGDISPYNWIRNLRLPNGRVPRMDLYGHNPFSARRPNLRNPPPVGPDVNYSDFSDLDSLVYVLKKNLRDAQGRRLRLFLSEYSLPTDHRNWLFPFYVSRKVQARWLADALSIVRRWPRIYTFGWYTLYDDPPRPRGDEFNGGLIDIQGRRKPAYSAFKQG